MTKREALMLASAAGVRLLETKMDSPKRPNCDGSELDMTPMVDVTFLMLIFFMVTASFSLQKSIQMPRQQSDAPSPSIDPMTVDQLESVEVQIDDRGNFLLLGPNWERETPSKQSLLGSLSDAMVGASGDMRLIVRVHEDAKLKSLVDCLDAGTIAGYSQMQVSQFFHLD
ncbi:ExbD/TolR family protein [Rubripirellula tenax]|nr:biopolymer transporter ExbD [Rubripirellula tenax]